MAIAFDNQNNSIGIGSTNRSGFTTSITIRSNGIGIGTIINIVPYDTLNSGTLSFEGSAGQLFSITNNLTSGSIFSVNDVSGIPSIDVDANGTVQLAPYGGNTGVGTTNPTQKLDVSGNLRLRGGLYDSNNSVGSASSVLISTGSGINWTSNIATSVVNTVAGTGSIELVRGNMADNDQFRILVSGTGSNSGYAEIATSDDGTEPIYVRQYTGVFSTIARTATLLDTSGNTSFPNNVTATAFYGSGQFLTNITPSSNLSGISTLGFFTDNQNITSSVTLPSNTLLYTVHKNINVQNGSTITIGSGTTIVMDRLNNLDDVVATSFKGDGSQLTGIPVGDLYELDSISPAGLENTYTPTFNYDTVSVTDPFRLLISVNGIVQSAYVHNTEYVFNNSLLASRTGYTIDYDGKIKFTEALPEGSEVMIKTTAGTTKSTTRRYPFNPLDVLF